MLPSDPLRARKRERAPCTSARKPHRVAGGVGGKPNANNMVGAFRADARRNKIHQVSSVRTVEKTDARKSPSSLVQGALDDVTSTKKLLPTLNFLVREHERDERAPVRGITYARVQVILTDELISA